MVKEFPHMSGQSKVLPLEAASMHHYNTNKICLPLLFLWRPLLKIQASLGVSGGTERVGKSWESPLPAAYIVGHQKLCLHCQDTGAPCCKGSFVCNSDGPNGWIWRQGYLMFQRPSAPRWHIPKNQTTRDHLQK